MSSKVLLDSNDRTMPKGRIDFRSWFLTVISWDGLLPACILLVPYLIEILFPNIPAGIEIAALLMPITGFFIRFVVGKRHIASNQCSALFRGVQYFFLGLGIFVMVFVDAVLILAHIVPNGVLWADRLHCTLWAVVALIYLTSMTIAMYPGRTKPSNP
jgi:hypothetical protein